MNIQKAFSFTFADLSCLFMLSFFIFFECGTKDCILILMQCVSFPSSLLWISSHFLDDHLINCVVLDLVVRIPVVSLNDEGRVVVVSKELEGEKLVKEPVNEERRKLSLNSIPFSLTCILHKNYILADPTFEEESIMETFITVVLNSSGQLVSLYKPGGPVLAHTSAIKVTFLLIPHLFIRSFIVR